MDIFKEKLNRLKKLDTEFKLFGASSHQYEFNPCMTESEVNIFEKKYSVQLPKDYRDFLLKIGNGGAGPYYGIFELEGGNEADITRYEALNRPFLYTQQWNIFDKLPYPEDDASDQELEEYEEKENRLYEELWNNQTGCLYICDYGCALRFFLVVTGEAKGQVWFDGTADKVGLSPKQNNDSTNLTFGQWYEHWLDSSLAEVEEIYGKL